MTPALAWLAGWAGLATLLVVALTLRMHRQERAMADLRTSVAQALEREARALALTNHLPASIAELDTQQRYVYVNAQLADSVGLPASSIVGRTVREVRGEALYEQWRPHLAEALNGGIGRAWVTTQAHGSMVHLKTVFVPKHDASGTVVGVYAISLDLTEFKQAHNELEALTRIDPLTGVANRRHFEERLGAALAHARRKDRQVAVLAIDIDNFKSINDSHGHAAGDAVLRELAQRVQRCVRQDDFLARLGGDEFVLLVEEPPESAGEIIANKLLSCATQPIVFDGKTLAVSLSIGVAYGDGHVAPEALVDGADQALYEAKRAGKRTFRIRR